MHKAEEIAGKAKRKIGDATGDTGLQAEGGAEEAKARAKQAADEVTERARQAADEIRGRSRRGDRQRQ
jgi:uncharacterized protein YjbJ (UPF0337 family)